MIKAVIIDDIPEAIEVLMADLKQYCNHIEIIGSDLVFLDIQMPDGSGFDLLEIIDDPNFKLIFTTASDEFAVKAFKFSAIDYLLKPIDPDDLIQAIQKIDAQINPIDRLTLLKANLDTPKKLALNTVDKIHIVDIEDIVRLESNINYTQFYFKDGTKLLVTKTLKEFDKLLSDYDFIRVHQSHLIAKNQIKAFLKQNGEIQLKDDTRVPVSTRKKAILMEMISKF